MLALLKQYSLYIFYYLGIFLALISVMGKTRWLFYFLIFLLPLRNVIERMHVFALGRDYLDILVGFLIIGTVVAVFTRRKKEEKTPISPVAVIAAVMILYTGFSLLVGSFYLNLPTIFSFADPRVQTWKNFCIMPILFLLVVVNMDDKKWVWRTVFVICGTMVLMDYYLIQQISWFSSLMSRNKINGTFVYLGPNEVAAFYSQYTIILMALFLAMRKNIWKLALGGLIWANIYCVLFLFSRAAYIASAAGMFVLFAVRKKILLIPLLVVIICWNTLLPAKVQERINMTTNEFGELDESAANRLLIWEQAVEVFQDNPIMGVGYGAFSNLTDSYLMDTHNIYLKTLADQGVIGFFIFMLLLLILFARGIKLYREGDDELSRALGIGFACAVIVLMINNLFGDRWTYLEVGSYFWIFAGLVEALNVRSNQVKINLAEARQKADEKKKVPAVTPPSRDAAETSKSKRKTYYNYYKE